MSILVKSSLILRDFTGRILQEQKKNCILTYCLWTSHAVFPFCWMRISLHKQLWKSMSWTFFFYILDGLKYNLNHWKQLIYWFVLPKTLRLCLLKNYNMQNLDSYLKEKTSAYGRHWISQCVLKVAPIPKWTETDRNGQCPLRFRIKQI